MAFAQAQVRLYGQYVAGDTKDAVSSYDRSMRLNGIHYYIEPHFNESEELYKIRIINHDFVLLSDYRIVLRHAERLMELMEYKYGPASRVIHTTDSIRCGFDTPYTVAYWKMSGKIIHIDIECKDDNYLHIVFTIFTNNFSSSSQFFGRFDN
jgi:hypothetical protein